VIRSQIRSKHLRIDAQFEREFLRCVRLRHDTSLRSFTSYVRGEAVPEHWRDLCRTAYVSSRVRSFDTRVETTDISIDCPYACYANDCISANDRAAFDDRSTTTQRPTTNPPPCHIPARAVVNRAHEAKASGASWPVISVLPKMDATCVANEKKER
jgi:hypothetical protein